MRGSSPRVRGTPFGCVLLAVGAGIIPACAGNTRTPRGFRTGRRDHPRVCGEHDHIGHGGIRVKGSSPRVRGTPGRRVCAQAMRGIIPACAGNTLRPSHASSMHGDHPRVCGEHTEGTSKTARWQGSSPRVRGTRTARTETGGDPGIIPACAGNTTSATHQAPSGGDHPRVCGEHSLMPSPSSSTSGSSPRVRGTPDGRRKSVEDMGIIPACAGNTVRWMSW